MTAARYSPMPPGEHLSREDADPVIVAVFACALAYSAWVLIEGWSQPLLDMYGFRQTQTAITVFWLLRGGPLVDYQTPVLGAPWTIPYEFPLYQWIVAAISKMFPIGLDSAGRLVCYLFFIATLWPLYRLFKLLSLSINGYFIAATLLMLSPIYIFWSRTFMMESTVLFFSMMFVAYLQSYLTRRQYGDLALATAAGIVAALVKITTFPAFALAGGILVLRDNASKGATWNLVALFRRYVITSISVVLPVILTVAWTHYADWAKGHNPLGRLLESGQLTFFNFGSLAQRVSSTLWQDVVFGRTLRDALGSPIVIWFSFGAVLLCSRGSQFYFLALAATYICPFLIFTNLHIVHSYYQYANAIFIVLAVAVVLSELRLRLPRCAFMALFIATCVTQVHAFVRNFEPVLLQNMDASPTILAARAIRQYTPPNSAIFVFGQDWSSETPYYSERKAVAFPPWLPPALLESVLSDPATVLGGLPLSAVVFCKARINQHTEPMVKNYLTQFKDGSVLSDVSGCSLFIKDALTKVIGTSLKDHFKIVNGEKCLGYIDGVDRTDIDGSYVVSGWAWNAARAEAAPDVLLVDSTDTIRGIAYPILPRPDVRHALPVVKQIHVGWHGYVKSPAWPLSAYSVQTNGGDACPLVGSASEPGKH